MYVYVLYVGMLTPIRLRGGSEESQENRAAAIASLHPKTICFFSDELL